MELDFNTVEEAKGIFDKEIEALVKTRDALGPDFEQILGLILKCQIGRAHV